MNTFSYRFGPSALTCITTPSNAAYNFETGDFTIEAWVKTFHGGPVLARMVDNHRGFVLTLDLNKVIFTTYDGSNWHSLEGSSSICDGVWHHVAAVRSASEIGSLHVDGRALTTEATGNTPPPLNVDSTDRLTIGTVDLTTLPNRFFRGLMAEVRLWNKARTDAEILEDIGQRLPAATLSPNLVGYWTAEYGYICDLSQYGNASTREGVLSGSGEIPPLYSNEIETFSAIFHGIYNISSTDPSEPLAKQLAVTTEGFVIIDGGKVIKGSKIQGTRLMWPYTGNDFAGDLRFLAWSDDDDTQQFSGTFIQNDPWDRNVKGRLAPVRVGCGIVLNVGTGLVLTCPNPDTDSEVLLAPKDPHTHDHFCRYDTGGILHMHSGQALKPGSPEAGARMFVTHPTINGPHQSWIMQDGNILLQENPSLALTGSGGEYPTLAVADSSDQAQQWLSLDNIQIVFNGMGGVLTGGTGTEIRVETKTDGSPQQGWYFFRNAVINAATAQALTTTGELNSSLSLAQWSPTNTAQQFIFTGTQLVHNATGYIVGITSVGGQPVLQESSTTGNGVTWSLNTPVAVPESATALERPKRDVSDTQNSTTYTVKIRTGDFIAAGTNDKVVIYMEGKSESMNPVELNANTTGTDPFERGQTDTFELKNLPDIGPIERITIHYGDNNWLWNDRWVVEYITVTNETRHTLSLFTPVGLPQFEMPSVQSFLADGIRYLGVATCTMAVDMAPAQDAIGSKFNWHHTWVTVVNDSGTPLIKTYFDCAGGHEAPGTINNVLTAFCDRQSVVRMSTGFPYDDTRPLKDAYGTNRTDGYDNANLRAEGRMNWQGQCHQIANRYLWACIPSTSLTSVPYDKRPNGYGHGVAAFGTFGIGFREWTRTIGLTKKAWYGDDGFFGLFRSLFEPLPIPEKLKRDILASRLDFQYDIVNEGSDEPAPNGPATRRFLTWLRDRGVLVNQLARMMNYTDAQINEFLS